MKKGDIVVRLDDSEQLARVAEIEGQLAAARVAVERAKINFDRVESSGSRTTKRRARGRGAARGASAEATVRQFEGTRALAKV